MIKLVAGRGQVVMSATENEAMFDWSLHSVYPKSADTFLPKKQIKT